MMVRTMAGPSPVEPVEDCDKPAEGNVLRDGSIR
jgi:hypothetical protein